MSKKESPTVMIVFTVFLSVISFYAGVQLFLQFYPFPTSRIDKFVLFYPEVKQGEKQCFQFEGEKFTNVSAQVLIELVNGEAINIMSYDSNTPAGTIFKKRCFIIPFTADPGKYRIRWTGKFRVNALKEILKVMLSEYFTVLPGESIGPQGLQGVQGIPGKPGESIRGVQGPKGDKGGISLFGKELKGDKGDPGDCPDCPPTPVKKGRK